MVDQKRLKGFRFLNLQYKLPPLSKIALSFQKLAGNARALLKVSCKNKLVLR